MKISTKGRYAIRLMLDLAENSNGEFIRLKDISARQEISEKYLEQITGILSKASLIKGVRGAQGGYKLIKKPSEYTVGSILRATEGNLAPVSCLETEDNLCERQDKCITLNFWKSFNKVINDYLESVSLQDIIDQNTALKGNGYVI